MNGATLMARIEGYAIVSADGMIANKEGQMTASLVFEADQRLFTHALEGADIVVHGLHSGEKPQSSSRCRLIVTSQVTAIAPVSSNGKAFLWNPAGLSFGRALAALGTFRGRIAILGGTRVFGLFLNCYDTFYLSRAAGVLLPDGRPVFPDVPASSPETVLANHGLVADTQQVLDREKGLTMTRWRRIMMPQRGAD